LVHLGNLVKVNDVALVVINRLTPIYVSFGVPAAQLGAKRDGVGARMAPGSRGTSHSPQVRTSQVPLRGLSRKS